MLYTQTIISILETLLITIPVLLTVAFVTVAERKTMASMQRRLGPNFTGYYGLLQAFADALKLLLKEYVSPTQANITLFFIGPIITLVFSLLGFAVIPYASSISISDFNLGILYILAMSSLATYGILISGWAANSKYAFLGSLRSTAQLISYELILSSAILLVILLTGNLNLIVNTEAQKDIYNMFPLFPVFIIFFIGCIAETNRPPFDLAEAESELVSGFMTEHAAVIFVFFFLAEYASIVLICILTSILFIGGYLYNLQPIILVYEYIDFDFFFNNNEFFNNSLIENLSSAVFLGIKACVMIFIFIWARASLPRIRFDQLMLFCWTILLPVVIGLIVLLPCVLFSYDIVITNTYLLGLPLVYRTSTVYKNSTESIDTILEDSQFIRDGANLVPSDTATQILPSIHSHLSLFNRPSYDRLIDRASFKYNQSYEQYTDIPNFNNLLNTSLCKDIKQGYSSLFEYFNNLNTDFFLYDFLYDSLSISLPFCALGCSLFHSIYHSFIAELYHITNPINNRIIARPFINFHLNDPNWTDPSLNRSTPNLNLAQWSTNLSLFPSEFIGDINIPQDHLINDINYFRNTVNQALIRANINIDNIDINSINNFNDLFSLVAREVGTDNDLVNRIGRLPTINDTNNRPDLPFTPTPVPGFYTTFHRQDRESRWNFTYTYEWRLFMAVHMFIDYVRFYTQTRLVLLHWDPDNYRPSDLTTGLEETPVVTLGDLGLSRIINLRLLIEDADLEFEYSSDASTNWVRPGRIIVSPKFIWDVFFSTISW